MTAPAEKGSFINPELARIFGNAADIKRVDTLSQKAIDAFTGRPHGEAALELELQEQFALEKYPEAAEEIILIFRTCQFLRAQIGFQKARAENAKGRVSDAERKLIPLAEQQFLFTHFIVQNQLSESYLKNLWQKLAIIANRLRAAETFETVKRGVLAQVTAFKAFEMADLKPKLTSPREDVRIQGDIWISYNGRKTLVQVKGHKNIGQSYVIGYGNVAALEPEIPPTFLDESKINEDKQKFAAFEEKMKRYNRDNQTAVEPILVALAEKDSNAVTGLPNQKLTQRLAKILKQN